MPSFSMNFVSQEMSFLMPLSKQYPTISLAQCLMAIWTSRSGENFFPPIIKPREVKDKILESPD